MNPYHVRGYGMSGAVLFLFIRYGLQFRPGELLPRFMDVVPEPETSTTRHLSYSLWFYRTRHTLTGTPPVSPISC